MAPANRTSAASTTQQHCESRQKKAQARKSGRAFGFVVRFRGRQAASQERAAYGQSTNTDKF